MGRVSLWRNWSVFHVGVAAYPLAPVPSTEYRVGSGGRDEGVTRWPVGCATLITLVLFASLYVRVLVLTAYWLGVGHGC